MARLDKKLSRYMQIRRKFSLYTCIMPKLDKNHDFKGLSSSYFSVFGILIFIYVIPLHPYIPKIKNSGEGGTLLSDILTQLLVPAFSLEILRKLSYFVIFTTKSLQNFFKLSKINLNYIYVKNNPKLTWQANLLFELLPC